MGTLTRHQANTVPSRLRAPIRNSLPLPIFRARFSFGTERACGQTCRITTGCGQLHHRCWGVHVQKPGLPDLNVLPNRVLSTLRTDYSQVSCGPDLPSLLYLHFNSPADLTLPTNTFGLTQPSSPLN